MWQDMFGVVISIAVREIISAAPARDIRGFDARSASDPCQEREFAGQGWVRRGWGERLRTPTWAASAPHILGIRARIAYMICRWIFTSLALCIRSFIWMRVCRRSTITRERRREGESRGGQR